MKKALIAILYLFFFAATYSQKNNVNVGLAIGLPTGTYSNVLSYAYEPSVSYEFTTSKTKSFTLSVSYMSYKGSDGIKVVGGVIPILAGYKSEVSKNTFIHFQAGLGIETEKKITALSLSPSVGRQISKKIDLSLKYFASFYNKVTESYIGLRIGYSFP